MDMRQNFQEDMEAARRNQVSPNIQEDKVTRTIENQTAKIPSVGYLTLAMGAMGVSAVLSLFFNRRPLANFFGLWVPSLLIMGLYNKVVKIESELVRQQLH